MSPQMEHAAVSEGFAQQGSRQRRPIGRTTMSHKPQEVLERHPLDRVLRERKGAVWVSLDRGWQQHDPRMVTWEVERQQFDVAHTEITCRSNHLQVPICVFAFRRTKHQAWQAGIVFEPGFRSGNLLPRLLLGGFGQDSMMQGMCTNLEGETELPDLGCRHRLVLGPPRAVKPS